MMNSAERMDYIIEYISAYESKIALANKNGLFDSATLFELFAINVCELWFGQKFHNLNEKRSNYPYVDLVSEDNTVYVQVSTVQDVSSKIKSTLEKIRDSKDNRFDNLKTVFFFVLNNDSIDQVKDYTGKDQIGRIDFEKDKHLITTQDVVSRAKSSLEFQMALYELLKRDNTKISEISSKLLTLPSLQDNWPHSVKFPSQFSRKCKRGVVSKLKQEFQLQEWSRMLQEQKAACPLRNGARSVACTAPAPGSPALGTYREMDKRQDPKTGPCRVSFRIGDYR